MQSKIAKTLIFAGNLASVTDIFENVNIQLESRRKKIFEMKNMFLFLENIGDITILFFIHLVATLPHLFLFYSLAHFSITDCQMESSISLKCKGGPAHSFSLRKLRRVAAKRTCVFPCSALESASCRRVKDTAHKYLWQSTRASFPVNCRTGLP